MYQVMIVDDEPEVLDRIEGYINQANLDFHVIAKAQGGEETLHFLEIVKPDVIITDIKMPDLDGLTMLRKIHETGWQGYVVLISGYDEFQYAQQAIRLNCHDYLLKPIFPDTIAEVLVGIKNCLQQKELELEQLRQEIMIRIEGENSPKEDDIFPEYIVKAKEFVAKHYGDHITLAQTAEHVSISPAYLSSRFASFCKRNFIDYVTHVRLVKAKELLGQTNLQVQEIAEHVGYSDVAYFNRIFRRKTKQTPSQYRKEIWKANKVSYE